MSCLTLKSYAASYATCTLIFSTHNKTCREMIRGRELSQIELIVEFRGANFMSACVKV